MLVEVETKTKMQIDISPEEAFRILCKSLDMEYVLDEETDKHFYVKENEYGEKELWASRNGQCDTCYDDNAGLFVALRNVAVNMFPNLEFRSEPYIYD